MDNFFHKAVVFSDAHFGRASDSPIANQDNLDFIDWMIDRARAWGAETCLFLGDWHHNRSTIGIESLDYGLRGLERLASAGFAQIVCLVGNHDLFRRHGRDITSLQFTTHIPAIRLIREPVTIGNVTLLPWLIEQEHQMLPSLKSRYVFAHLETIGAMMNAKVKCLGGQHAIEADCFAGRDYVMSGHFHQRQTLNNIVYIGSVMPFDFNDANDAERGLMLLEWGRDPLFEAWPQQPLYHTTSLSGLLDNLSHLRPKMTVRATIDIDLHHEESQQIRDSLINSYDLRKFELIKPAADLDCGQMVAQEFHSIDQIVIDGLRSIDSSSVSAERLVAIFDALPRR